MQPEQNQAGPVKVIYAHNFRIRVSPVDISIEPLFDGKSLSMEIVTSHMNVPGLIEELRKAVSFVEEATGQKLPDPKAVNEKIRTFKTTD